jgi:hyperosmotically inducible protein
MSESSGTYGVSEESDAGIGTRTPERTPPPTLVSRVATYPVQVWREARAAVIPSIFQQENAMNVRKLSSFAAAAFVGLTLAACAGTSTTKSTGDVVDDAWIATKVKSKLVDDPMTKARDIQVETFKGTVQLAGYADSQAEIDRAVALASSTQGVKSVRNNITLKQTTR